MTDWANRPLDGVYAAVFIDAIVVKVRDGQVANRPIYAAIGVSLAGEKDVLGLWAGTGGEGAKFWMAVLTDLKNRGVNDVFFLVCDGLKGLPDVVGERVAADHGPDLHHPPDPQHVPARVAAGLGPAETRREADLHRRRTKPPPGPRWTSWPTSGAPSIRRSSGCGSNAWAEFIPFLDYDVEIRTVICSTNAIESLERPLPAGGEGPRPLPHRAGRDEMSVPGHPIPGPDR